MKKVKVTVSGEMELHYDETSQEFKDAIEGYRTIIDPSGDVEDMLQSIACMIVQFGREELIEGCGYVSINGRKQIDYFHGGKERIWCGVNAVGKFTINDTIEFDVDTEEID
ncbi:MAG: hypothetical protein LBK58_07390 [Prevotellaceae bacterium]|jgi:hypothetical protein|nr:hypothetical protein [Prevotellaceae bacterium]